MSWKCPRCGGTNLRVTVSSTAILHQDGDLFETEIIGDHEWYDDSYMLCADCDFGAHAEDFEGERK